MDKDVDWCGLSFFAGGMSTDQKLGSRNQFYTARHLDFRKNPNVVTVLPQPTKVSGGIVTDLVLNMCLLPDGKYYGIGDAGNVYKVGLDGIWSLFGNIGQAGMDINYRADTDAIYIAGISKVARIKTATTNPTFQENWFEGGITTSSGAYKTNGMANYRLQTTAPETANQIRGFYTNISPIRKIGVQINIIGTGDWTLTLHDDANNILATKTIINANLQANKINFFESSTAVDASVNTSTTVTPNSRQYHFHLTSTVADGKIATTTEGSMADCDFQIYADALTTTINGLHPMDRFINFTLIGNGRYVTGYEPLQDIPTPADYERHRIILPPGYEVCSFAQRNLMSVISAEQRSSDGKFQAGALFFWDGKSDSYNDWWPVPEGSPESMFAEKNVGWYIAAGTAYRMRGMEEPKEKRTFRGTDSEYSNITDITHSYPHMMTIRRTILLMGYPSTTTVSDLEYAVYSYGSAAPEFPESFGISYTPSPGVMFDDGSNNFEMGMVRNYVDTLFISWRNGTTYGVDRVNNSSLPAATANLESLKYDMDRPQFFKKAQFLLATFNELPDGISIILKYRMNGSTTWLLTDAVTSGSVAMFNIEKQFLNIEFGIDIAVTGMSSPEITSLYLFYDPQKKEAPVNPGNMNNG